MTQLIVIYIWLWGYSLTISKLENSFRSYSFSWWLAVFLKWPYIFVKLILKEFKKDET